MVSETGDGSELQPLPDQYVIPPDLRGIIATHENWERYAAELHEVGRSPAGNPEAVFLTDDLVIVISKWAPPETVEEYRIQREIDAHGNVPLDMETNGGVQLTLLPAGHVIIFVDYTDGAVEGP